MCADIFDATLQNFTLLNLKSPLVQVQEATISDENNERLISPLCLPRKDENGTEIFRILDLFLETEPVGRNFFRNGNKFGNISSEMESNMIRAVSVETRNPSESF